MPNQLLGILKLPEIRFAAPIVFFVVLVSGTTSYLIADVISSSCLSVVYLTTSIKSFIVILQSVFRGERQVSSAWVSLLPALGVFLSLLHVLSAVQMATLATTGASTSIAGSSDKLSRTLIRSLDLYITALRLLLFIAAVVFARHTTWKRDQSTSRANPAPLRNVIFACATAGLISVGLFLMSFSLCVFDDGLSRSLRQWLLVTFSIYISLVLFNTVSVLKPT